VAGTPNPMKTQRFASRAISASILAGIATLAVTSCSPRQEQFQDLPGLLSAMQAYSRDLTNRGLSLPQSVSLDDLVSHGYISSNSVRAFEGMEARVWFGVSETEPQKVLMSARLADGSVSAALADGSVHHFSAQSFAERLKQTGQAVQRMGASPSAQETNQAPSAAGSHR
jgi:hypothetical protein